MAKATRKSIPHVKNTNWRFVSNTDLIFLWHGFFMSHFIKEYPSLIVFFLVVVVVLFYAKGEFKFFCRFFHYVQYHDDDGIAHHAELFN